MLSNLTIRKKIYLLGFSILSLLAFIGGISVYSMNRIGNELVDIAEEDIPLSKAISKISEHQLQQAVMFERFLLHAILVNQGAYQFERLSSEQLQVKSIVIETKSEITALEISIKKAIPHLTSKISKSKYQELLGDIQEVQRIYLSLVPKIESAMDMGINGEVKKMLEQIDYLETEESKVDQKLSDLVDKIQSFTLKAAVVAEEHEKNAVKLISLAFLIAILVGLVLPKLIATSITTPINSLNKRLIELAEGDGDLRVRLDDKAKDETGDLAKSFNKFLITLNEMIAEVNGRSGHLQLSSESIVSSMQETLDSVLKQSEVITSVASSIHEMNITTQEVARNTAEAAFITEEVKQKVILGYKGASETQTAIDQVVNEVSNASNVIQCLVAETNNISSVLNSIQSIAEQTNLLALNAAIEAARAGESGRGFAVVADEVRHLAQRTRTSTIDIQKLVESLQLEAHNAVSSMQKGNDSTKLCLTKSIENAELFEEAARSVSTIADLNTQIATATEEQSVVAEEINQSLNNINEIASITATQTKKSATENNNISEGISNLHKSLSIFKISNT